MHKNKQSGLPYTIGEPFFDKMTRRIEFPSINLGIETARRLLNIRLKREDYLYLRFSGKNIAENNGITIKKKDYSIYYFVKGDENARDIRTGLLRHIYLPGSYKGNIIASKISTHF